MHIPSVPGKGTHTEAVAEDTPEQLSLSLGPLGDNCWLSSPACLILLTPNSMVPPSATSPGVGQHRTRCKAMICLHPLGQTGFSPGPSPVVSMVLLQTARIGMGFVTHCHTGKGGAQAKEPSGAKLLLSFGVWGLRDTLWRGQLWRCFCPP